MTTLLVRRAKVKWQDRVRSYRVIIDDNEVAQVANGAEVEVPVTAGKHIVQLKIDWCQSEALEIDVASGERQILECGPNVTPWLALLCITVSRKKYLWLRPAPSPFDQAFQRTAYGGR
ncbi:MAG: hypothetical protein ING77_04935 [Rhodocyclaceae bacterium]|nr:hypothetical protein [Rhodocyclaceae bacterium]MCA3150508.1 hypothetical protein [Rhodocyclaceae bacterium]MCA3155868.1 hypothetical protein [Burkholderiales bacterium]